MSFKLGCISVLSFVKIPLSGAELRGLLRAKLQSEKFLRFLYQTRVNSKTHPVYTEHNKNWKF